MNISESELAGTADRLRALVVQGRYAEAQACLDEYCLLFKETVRRLPSGDPRLPQMEAEWRRLLDQTRRKVLTGRAHAATRLERLPRRRPLYSAIPLPRHTWDLLG